MLAFAHGPISTARCKPRERRQPEPASPVNAILSKFDASIPAIVLDKEKVCDGALHGMADVAHIKRIAIAPAVQIIEGVDIATE